MEFYANADVRMSVAEIQRQIKIGDLPQWCASIDKVLSYKGNEGTIYCVWGEHHVHRELILEGVRFSLPSCLHAVQWTVTANTHGDVQVHCTINSKEDDPDFIESLEQFVADWKAGIEGWPARRSHGLEKPCVTCGDTFGGFG